MKIIVCCKIVPEEQDITVDSSRQIDVSRATAKISQYDLNAIECAVELAGADGEVVALTAGPAKWLDNTKIRKDILSRGPARLEIIMDSALENAMPLATAETLAKAAEKIGFDLIICGEGSGDLYAQQTGILLGEILGVPSINAISSIKIEGNSVLAERTLEQETQVLEFPLPAVVSVTSDINTPRVPTMKAILGAGKKPVNVQDLAAIGAKPEAASVVVSILAPEAGHRENKIFQGDDEKALAEFTSIVGKLLRS